MNIENIDTKIKLCELQLESSTGSNAKCDYTYELANLRFNKHIQLLKQKAYRMNSERSSILDLLKKHLPTQF